MTLDDDVAAAVQRLRKDEGVGLSEALNELARAGLRVRPRRARFRQRSAPVTTVIINARSRSSSRASR